MKECPNNLNKLAMNLTKDEFLGYCKGMSLHWFFKLVDDRKRNPTAHKRVRFWDESYEKYKHNCKTS